MKERTNTKYNQWISYGYGIFFFILGFLYLKLVAHPVYAVNDDLFMKNILSGAYLGYAKAYLIYMGYPLAFLLKQGYEINSQIPWYGIFLLSCHLLAISLVIQRGVSTRKSVVGRLLTFASISVICIVADLSHLLLIQYTVTAAILGSAAIFWFVTSDTTRGIKHFLLDNLVTISLIFLCYEIRSNVFLMLLPIAGMLWIGKWLNDIGGLREKKKYYLGLVGLLSGVILISALINGIAYDKTDWKEYGTFNQARTVLYDYCGWPDYEANTDLYQSLEITKEEYELATKGYILSFPNHITTHALIQLADHAKEEYKQSHPILERVKSIVTQMVFKGYLWSDRPVNLLVVGLYGFILVLGFLAKKKRVFLEIGCLLLGRVVAWSVLIYQGRFPIRVTQSLFLVELFALLGIYIVNQMWIWEIIKTDQKINKKRAICVGFVILCYSGLLGYLGKQTYERTGAEVNSRSITATDLIGVKEYCNAHPEAFYYLDNDSVTFFTEEVFKENESQYQNCMVLGGWLSNSPVYEEKLAKQGITNVETNLVTKPQQYIIFQDNENCSSQYLMDYYQSKYDSFQYKVVDQFSTKHVSFLVYQLGE